MAMWKSASFRTFLSDLFQPFIYPDFLRNIIAT